MDAAASGVASEGGTLLPLAAEVAFAIGALRSNNDVLLHKTPRTPVVNEQLVLNRNAIGRLKAALLEVGVRVN